MGDHKKKKKKEKKRSRSSSSSSSDSDQGSKFDKRLLEERKKSKKVCYLFVGILYLISL